MPHINLPVIVETDALNGSEIQIKIIDYNSRADREWLSRHCLWAMHNMHEVRTRNAKLGLHVEDDSVAA